MVEALDRSRSDHAPLLLNTGVAFHYGNRPQFKFELGWFIHDGFTWGLYVVYRPAQDEDKANFHT